ncbi:MAG: hypothetical protein JWO13_1027 [Acidobacteriales bacterium]|nr:hypothetical protein [Terriglobales bacterium]
MSKGMNIALWIVSALLAALFLFAGGMKLLHRPEMGAEFVKIGFPAWFSTFIGVCEVLGGIALLVSRVRALGAACLSVIMVGAVYTTVIHQPAQQAAVPLICFALLVWISYARFNESRA